MFHPAAIISFIVSLSFAVFLFDGSVFAQAISQERSVTPARTPLRLFSLARSAETPKTSSSNALPSSTQPPAVTQSNSSPSAIPSNYANFNAPTSFFGSLAATKRYPVDEVPPNERIVYVPYRLPSSLYGMRGQPMPVPWGDGVAVNGYWYPNMSTSMYPYPLPGIPIHHPYIQPNPQPSSRGGWIPQIDPQKLELQLWFPPVVQNFGQVY